jgi:hypothetical protein
MALDFKVTIKCVGADAPETPPSGSPVMAVTLVGEQPLPVSFNGPGKVLLHFKNSGDGPAVYPSITVEKTGEHAANVTVDLDSDNFTVPAATEAGPATHDMTVTVEANKAMPPTATWDIDVEYVTPAAA